MRDVNPPRPTPPERGPPGPPPPWVGASDPCYLVSLMCAAHRGRRRDNPGGTGAARPIHSFPENCS